MSKKKVITNFCSKLQGLENVWNGSKKYSGAEKSGLAPGGTYPSYATATIHNPVSQFLVN